MDSLVIPPPRRTARRHRGPVTAAGLVSLLGAGLLLWRDERSEAQAPPPPPPTAVTAVRAERIAMSVAVRAVGTLRADRQVVITTEVPGRITRLLFNSGDQVSTGQALVQLNDQPERASQRTYGAAAQLAAIQLGRARQLVALGAESQDVVDRHFAERQQAQAEIGRTGALIAQKSVLAPFPGTLGIRRVDLGQYVSPGEAIATLTDLSEIKVEFQVPQKYLNELRAGREVFLTSDVWPGRRFTARIEASEHQISATSRSVAVQARLLNHGGALRPGMYVDVSLAGVDQQQAVAVPASAIMSSVNGESVLLIDDLDAKGVGTARPQPVKTGERRGDRVQILEGLAAGQQVISAGQLRVRPGASVRIVGAQLYSGTRAAEQPSGRGK